MKQQLLQIVRRIFGRRIQGEKKNELHFEGAELANVQHQFAHDGHEQPAFGSEGGVNVVVGDAGAMQIPGGAEALQKLGVSRVPRSEWLEFVRHPKSLTIGQPPRTAK